MLKNVTWKDLYFYLRGICAGTCYVYRECNTACVIDIKKREEFINGCIIICNTKASDNYRILALKLGHELGHVLSFVSNGYDVFVRPRQYMSSEVEAMDFVLSIVDKFGVRLTKSDEREINKLMKLCSDYDINKSITIGEIIKKTKGEE